MGQRVVIMVVLFMVLVGSITTMLLRRQADATDDLFDTVLAHEAREVANTFGHNTVRELKEIVESRGDYRVLNKTYSDIANHIECTVTILFDEANNIEYPLPGSSIEIVPSGEYLIISKASITAANGMVYTAETHILLALGEDLTPIEKIPQFDPSWIGNGPYMVSLGDPSDDEISFYQQRTMIPDISIEVGLEIVHYTRTGIKYHRENCRYLSKSDFSATMLEALYRGLTPCLVCCPDVNWIHQADPSLGWELLFTLNKIEVEELHNIIYFISDEAVYVKGVASYDVTIVAEDYIMIPETVEPRAGSNAVINIWGRQAVYGIASEGDPGVFPHITTSAQTARAHLYSMGPIEGPLNPYPMNTNPTISYVRRGSNTILPVRWLNYDNVADPNAVVTPLWDSARQIRHWVELPMMVDG